MSRPGRLRYIAIEGPIGVGKTGLATRLAGSFGSELVLEDAGENPFLERFYQDQRNGALPAQLYFLLQRARKVQAMRQADMFDPVRVSDFLLDKDRIFAQLTLDRDEYGLYQHVYEKLAIDAPVPDLVVYLQAPVDVLLGRIARRGVACEQAITSRYLERVSEAYARFFHDYDASPLLMVNTGGVDLVNDDAEYAELHRLVLSMRSGRHFFNPAGGVGA